MIVTKESIGKGKDKIREMILAQAEFGEQSKVVKSVKSIYFAIGQFLGDHTRSQRGIHGSSNALLALVDTNRKDVVNGVVRYLENRVNIERQLAGSSAALLEERWIRDEKNTIKISEILYALRGVKPALAKTETFVNFLKTKLVNGQRKNGNETGWRYFTDDSSDELLMLPTSYAVLALNRNGYSAETNSSISYLRDLLTNSSINNPTELAEVVFALYALIKSDPDYKKCENTYKSILANIWKSQYCTLSDNFEQNIEYWSGAHHEYIRIPWQLFLLSIASKISNIKFYSLKSQRLLTSIINDAQHSDFKYPYSGPYISTRTNAILYDVLSDIEASISNNILYTLLYKASVAIHKIRNFFGSQWVKYLLSLIGIIAAFISMRAWYLDKESSFKDFAPEFFGWIAIGLILLGKKR